MASVGQGTFVVLLGAMGVFVPGQSRRSGTYLSESRGKKPTSSFDGNRSKFGTFHDFCIWSWGNLNLNDLLTFIESLQFILNWNDSPKRTHRRSSSFPVNLHSARHNEKAVRKESSLDSSCIAEETNREMQQMSKLWASFPTLNHDRDFEFPTCSRRASGTEIEVKSKIALSDAIRVDYLDGKEPKPMERKIPTKIRLFSRKGRHRTKVYIWSKTNVFVVSEFQ